MSDLLKLLKKELRLTASPLSFLFLAFAAMALIPNYPPLVGGFFICFGIFHSFQNAREAGDTLYTVLLPIAKKYAVLGKYVFTAAIETVGFLLFAALMPVRFALEGHGPYSSSAMMVVNPAFLGFLLVFYAIFNTVFLIGFYRTAYAFGKPFVCFCVAGFLWIGVCETLHHLPGLEALNGTTLSFLPGWLILLGGAVIFVLATLLSYRRSAALFETIDL